MLVHILTPCVGGMPAELRLRLFAGVPIGRFCKSDLTAQAMHVLATPLPGFAFTEIIDINTDLPMDWRLSRNE